MSPGPTRTGAIPHGSAVIGNGVIDVVRILHQRMDIDRHLD
jgi:plasmid stabilization system protein ParE